MSTRRRFRLGIWLEALSWGGVQVMMASLVAALDPAIGVFVLGPAEDTVQAIAAAAAGATAILLPPAGGRRRVDRLARVHLALRRLDLDLLLINHELPLYGHGAALATYGLPNTRVVGIEHHVASPPDPATLRAKRRILRRLDGLISVSHAVERSVSEHFGMLPPITKVIYSGVEPAPVPARDDPCGRTIGTITRLVGGKGVEDLITAIAHIADAQLVVVGDGGGRPALEHLAHDLGVHDRIRFAGFTRDARAWYDKLDVFALPSRSEAGSIAIMEALAAGCPVVSTRCTAIPEIVDDGVSGILVPPGDIPALRDALAVLLDDPARRREYGRAGFRRWQRDFTVPRMAREYERLFDDVVRTPRSASSAFVS